MRFMLAGRKGPFGNLAVSYNRNTRRDKSSPRTWRANSTFQPPDLDALQRNKFRFWQPRWPLCVERARKFAREA
jgi:hypothetical protein